jgi:hypothetical protein
MDAKTTLYLHVKVKELAAAVMTTEQLVTFKELDLRGKLAGIAVLALMSHDEETKNWAMQALREMRA